MDEIIRSLAASGPIGIVAAIAIIVAYKKDQQIKDLNDKMLAWQERVLDRYHGAINEVNKTVRALSESTKNDEEN